MCEPLCMSVVQSLWLRFSAGQRSWRKGWSEFRIVAKSRSFCFLRHYIEQLRMLKMYLC